MDGTKLTASEWNILNFLWESGSSTVMQIVGEMERTVGWARSTTVTTLSRMETKGLVRREPASQGKPYIPLVERDQAALVEAHSFLDRVYQGSVGLMMSAMVKQEGLSQQQIAQLRAILDEAEQEAGK